MKKVILLTVLTFLTFRIFAQSADITLYMESDVEIDSIFVSNISQDKEFQFLKYSNPLLIKFSNPVSDLYNIDFYTKKGFKRSLYWLEGKNIIIKGKVSERIKIDTVIGSPIYYRAIAFKKAYTELLNSKSDSATVNQFLLTSTEDNINSLLSLEPAQNFLYRNISRPSELKKLYDVLIGQNDVLKNHAINPFKKLEKILSETKIDLSAFRFQTPDNKFTTLKLIPGKKYLLDLWFVGCAPCIRDHQIIKEKLDLFKNNNVEVIGISIDQNQKLWSNFLKEKKYTWLNVREVDDSEKKLRTKLMIELYPTYLILDSEANILYRTNSLDEATNYLKL